MTLTIGNIGQDGPLLVHWSWWKCRNHAVLSVTCRVLYD